ncbi:MAG: replication-associated recombination protein A [Acidobacteriota bacterium]
MSLFAQIEKDHLDQARPLAARMRPRDLDEFVGQEQVVGPGSLLRRLIAARRLESLLIHGPPGTGKTSLARLLAGLTRSRFRQVSAVASNVKELRGLLDEARGTLRAEGTRTLLFIDEIHRFNRAQQDVLLRDLEEGVVVLVGATTENPFFAINSALLSRSRVVEFLPLSAEDIERVLRRALSDRERGLGRLGVRIDEEALRLLATLSGGDARRALSALEIGVAGLVSRSTGPVSYTLEVARESLVRAGVPGAHDPDAHHDVTSALIKSIRGSDVDAAIYWLARMLESGEDIRFIARRLIILASEDVGNADPHALPLAVAAMQACEFVGLPECQLPLAQAVAYLACAPKSNAATAAIGEARLDVRTGQVVPVPRHLHLSPRVPTVPGNQAAYVSPHGHPDGVVPQEYLGVDRTYYRPVGRGFESELAERLVMLRERLREGR